MKPVLIVLAHGVDHLGFKSAHFDVRKGNERVWRFHERFGAQRVAETSLDYLYNISSQSIASARQRYRRFLIGTFCIPQDRQQK